METIWKSFSFSSSWNTEENVMSVWSSNPKLRSILWFLFHSGQTHLTLSPCYHRPAFSSESHISSISPGGPFSVFSECSHYVFTSPHAVNHVRDELFGQKENSLKLRVQYREKKDIPGFGTVYWLFCTFTAKSRVGLLELHKMEHLWQKMTKEIMNKLFFNGR